MGANTKKLKLSLESQNKLSVGIGTRKQVAEPHIKSVLYGKMGAAAVRYPK